MKTVYDVITPHSNDIRKRTAHAYATGCLTKDEMDTIFEYLNKISDILNLSEGKKQDE